MAHAFTADLGKRHFHAALFADHAAVLEALVFAAQALVVLDRSEDLGAKQAVTFGLEGTVVDGFRLFDFAVRPGTDLLRGCDADLNGVEMFSNVGLLLEQVTNLIHHGTYSLALALASRLIRSMSIPSDRISRTSTLKDSGMPASI